MNRDIYRILRTEIQNLCYKKMFDRVLNEINEMQHFYENYTWCENHTILFKRGNVCYDLKYYSDTSLNEYLGVNDVVQSNVLIYRNDNLFKEIMLSHKIDNPNDYDFIYCNSLYNMDQKEAYKTVRQLLYIQDKLENFFIDKLDNDSDGYETDSSTEIVDDEYFMSDSE